MQQDRLILPEHVMEQRPLAQRTRQEDAAALGMTEEGVIEFIQTNPAIQRDLKKAKKAYARLQATIKHEAEALARSKEAKGEL